MCIRDSPKPARVCAVCTARSVALRGRARREEGATGSSPWAPSSLAGSCDWGAWSVACRGSIA
eukprot:14877431-Alexandrium_andersonii.AAC.1